MKAKFIYEAFQRGKGVKRSLNVGASSKVYNAAEEKGIPEDAIEITDDFTILPTQREYIEEVAEIAKEFMDEEKAKFLDKIVEKRRRRNQIGIQDAIRQAYKKGLDVETIEELVSGYVDDTVRKGYAKIALAKMKRSQKEKQEEDQYNTYIFIGYNDKAPVEIQGEKYYKDKFSAEKMIKIDKYNAADLNMVPIMKMRGRAQYGGDAGVYMIKVPKDFMDKESYNGIPDFAQDVVEKYSTPI